MPNTGKPSKDCHLCRQRRVKCDLARPGCQRCVKYGVECPGYRNQQELVFRTANPATAKNRKKRGQHGADQEPPKTSSPTFLGTTVSPGKVMACIEVGYPTVEDPFLVFSDAIEVVPSAGYKRELMPLTKSLHEHWTSHSVPILLNVYHAVDLMQNLYQEHCGDGPLIWAAHVFSRTYFTNVRYPTAIDRASELETKRELGKYLGKTLSAVGALLKTPDGPLRDDVLATVWILANYELLVGSMNGIEALSPWDLHTQGLYSILKARGSKMLLTTAGRTAFWPAYNMVQIQALVNNTECPPESAEWLSIIRDNIYEGEALTLHVSMFVSKVAHALSTGLTILRTRDYRAAENQYSTIVSNMRAAENEMHHFFISSTETKQSLDVYMHNMYESGIIKAHHIIHMLTNLLSHYAASHIPLEELNHQREVSITKIRIAADNINESAPAAMGALAGGGDKSPRALFDALKLIWPLSAIYISPETLPAQKHEAVATLIFIGREFGVRQALNTYPESDLPTEAQTPLELNSVVL